MRKQLFYVLWACLWIFFAGSIFSPAMAQQKDSTAIADSTLLNQIKQQLGENTETQTTGTSSSSTFSTQGVRASSANSNPKISAIGDFRGLYTSAGNKNWDAYVQGVELNLSSAIDPYARADFYPVFEGEGGELHAHIEEAYLTTIGLPYNLQLKAGKFRQTFGRLNTVHSHALPVIDVPLASEYFLGEALISQGLSLSWLIPNRRFYQEIVAEVSRGPGEGHLFARNNKNNRPQVLGHLKNFWDLTDNATLELGLSGVFGSNDSSRTATLGGVDITYKWKPVRFNTYHSFEWQTEFYFSSNEVEPGQKIKAWGMYSWIKYQLSRRWFATTMYSYAEDPFTQNTDGQAISATFGWYATEFQKLEFGPKLSTLNGFGDSTFSALFKWVFVIGSHGAHQY